jgi:hypothetical protein
LELRAAEESLDVVVACDLGVREQDKFCGFGGAWNAVC